MLRGHEWFSFSNSQKLYSSYICSNIDIGVQVIGEKSSEGCISFPELWFGRIFGSALALQSDPKGGECILQFINAAIHISSYYFRVLCQYPVSFGSSKMLGDIRISRLK
jgi:hypothetical protein